MTGSPASDAADLDDDREARHARLRETDRAIGEQASRDRAWVSPVAVDALRREMTATVARRDAGIEQAKVTIAKMTADLQAARRRAQVAETRIQSMLSSRTWRVGVTVLRPVNYARKRVRK